MDIEINADGITGRISVTDDDGHELLRIRNASSDALELAELIKSMTDNDADG